METLNEAYQQGKFERLGLSNFPPDKLEAIVAIAKKNGMLENASMPCNTSHYLY